jgi:hypothetical protein
MDPMMGGMDPNMMGGMMGMDPMMGGMDPNMMGGMMGMDPMMMGGMDPMMGGMDPMMGGMDPMMGGMMGMDPMMGGMDPMMGMGMDPGMGQMGQMMQMGMDMGMGMQGMMDMGMDMGMNMNPMEGMMGEMGGMMGMDPSMQGAMQGMMEMYMPGQENVMPGQENMMPGQEYMMPGQENMMPGQENMMPGQNIQYGNEFMENNMPGENQYDPEENQGFVGEMWNGIFYGPGQELALQQAQIAYPNGYMNGGQGENFGGGGSMVRMAQPGPDMLQGQSNVQDTFVFNLSDANGYNSAYNPATLMGNAMSGDIIMDFDPADGDKIKIMDGADPLSPAEAASILSVAQSGAMYATYITGTSGVLFSSTQFELSSVLESNFTDV